MAHYSIELFKSSINEHRVLNETLRLQILENTICVLNKYFLHKPVTSLYITGSLIQANRFKQRSDIDIAVEGLQSNIYFSCISELEGLLNRHVEIIELENCRFANKIKETGLKII